MVHTEGAKLMTVDELTDLMGEEFSNPTIDRMVFVETKAKDGKEGRLFPMLLEAWAYEDMSPVKAHASVMIRGCILQSKDGEFGMVRVAIRESELNETKRIWDKPPTKGLRDDTKWPGDEDQPQ